MFGKLLAERCYTIKCNYSIKANLLGPCFHYHSTYQILVILKKLFCIFLVVNSMSSLIPK